MIDLAARHTHDTMPAGTQTPTEVNLFHVRKEASVKSTDCTIGSSAHKKRGACCPEDIARGIILVAVLFYGIEDTATTEGIAIAVNEPSRSTRIFKMCLTLEVKYLGLTGNDTLIGIKSCDKRFKPARRYLDIRIEQKDIIGSDRFECLVVPVGKTVVPVKDYKADRRELLLHKRHRTVGRGIVRNNDVGTGSILHNRREETP